MGLWSISQLTEEEIAILSAIHKQGKESEAITLLREPEAQPSWQEKPPVTVQ